MFQNQQLAPASELIEVPHIGPYLYDRIRREFTTNVRSLSIRGFASSVQNMSLDTLQRRLQKALQNARNNQCVSSRRPYRSYHVPDVNKLGYAAMIGLVKTIGAGNDGGHNLGRNWRLDASRLRLPRERSNGSKYLSCIKTRTACQNRGGVFVNRMCQPQPGDEGFPGVRPHAGQKVATRNNTNPRRGNYVQSANGATQWRMPGALPKV